MKWESIGHPSNFWLLDFPIDLRPPLTTYPHTIPLVQYKGWGWPGQFCESEKSPWFPDPTLKPGLVWCWDCRGGSGTRRPNQDQKYRNTKKAKPEIQKYKISQKRPEAKSKCKVTFIVNILLPSGKNECRNFQDRIWKDSQAQGQKLPKGTKNKMKIVWQGKWWNWWWWGW